jgi:hypothetical protein
LDMKWNLIVVWICIFLMSNDAEHLFMYLLTISIFSLEKCISKYIQFFAYILIGWFIFLLLCYKTSLYMLGTQSFMNPSWFTNTLFYSLGYSFHFLDGTVFSTEVSNLIWCSLSVFCCCLGFWCHI